MSEKSFATREAAVKFATERHTEYASTFTAAAVFDVCPGRVEWAGDEHVWVASTVYCREKFMCRELRLWHVFEFGGEWWVESKSTRGLHRYDCSDDMLRGRGAVDREWAKRRMESKKEGVVGW